MIPRTGTRNWIFFFWGKERLGLWLSLLVDEPSSSLAVRIGCRERRWAFFLAHVPPEPSPARKREFLWLILSVPTRIRLSTNRRTKAMAGQQGE